MKVHVPSGPFLFFSSGGKELLLPGLIRSARRLNFLSTKQHVFLRFSAVLLASSTRGLSPQIFCHLLPLLFPMRKGPFRYPTLRTNTATSLFSDAIAKDLVRRRFLP